MSTVKEVTMESFEATVDENALVLLDFWAEWCKPCQVFMPAYTLMAEQHPEIFFGKVNVDMAQDLAQAFQVRSVPTLMAFKKGELVFEQPGVLSPAQFTQLIENLKAE